MLTNHGSVPTDQNFQSLDSLSLTSDFTGILEIVSGEIVFHGIDTSWSEFLGYSAEELRNKPFMNFVFPEDFPLATALKSMFLVSPFFVTNAIFILNTFFPLSLAAIRAFQLAHLLASLFTFSSLML